MAVFLILCSANRFTWSLVSQPEACEDVNESAALNVHLFTNEEKS